MRIEITVVPKFAGTRYFQDNNGYEGTSLQAGDYEGGKLSVIRNGKVISQTLRIAKEGPSFYGILYVYFIGLANLFDSDPSGSHKQQVLYSQEFKAGDVIIIDTPT